MFKTLSIILMVAVAFCNTAWQTKQTPQQICQQEVYKKNNCQKDCNTDYRNYPLFYESCYDRCLNSAARLAIEECKHKKK